MSTLVTFLHVLVCIILVGTVLLQQGKGGGMGGAFGGANAQTVFGSGGASVFLRRMTAVAATVFMLTAIVLAYIASSDAGDALKSFSSQQAALKKRKKEAETKALEGAGGGTGAGTAAPGAIDTTGGAVNDGDTGEDELPGANGPTDIEVPTPVENKAAGEAVGPATTVPSGAPTPLGADNVPGRKVTLEKAPAPATTKPAATETTKPPAATTKPAATPTKPATETTKPAATPTKPAATSTTKPSATTTTKPAAPADTTAPTTP